MRQIKRGDTWPPLPFTLEETLENGTKVPINYSAALKVKIILKSGPTVVTGTCTPIESGEHGKGEYIWAEADTQVAGIYEVEFEIEWSATKFETVPNGSFQQIAVVQDLGGH